MESMFAAFYQYTNQIIPFTESERQILEDAFTFCQVPRRFKLTEEGKIAKELYFILKGLVRLYYTKDARKSLVTFSANNSLPAAMTASSGKHQAYKPLKLWRTLICLL
jgi:CRP-like cAMP-binding protein